MVWTPEATVTINGIDYTGNTLEAIRVTRGRDDVFTEPRAGYAICELIDLNGSGLGIQPLQRMSISIKNSVGTTIPVFTGNVTDTAEVLFDTGFESGTVGTIVTVIAVAPLARLNRRQVAAGGLPQQGDGDRIAELVEQGLAATWEETGGTWATVATPTTTWATFDTGLNLDLIDQPGVFTVAELDPEPGGYQPLSQGYLTAISGRGIIYDTADGFIAYADSNNRRDKAAADGYLPLDDSIINAAGLTFTSTQADITNRVIVLFDGGSVTVTDTGSLLDYGLLAFEFETNLANQTQAEGWAIDYLEDHRRPILKVSGLSIRLDGLDDIDLDAILQLDVNSPVQVFGIDQFPGFVEGLDWAINRETATLTLNVSDAALSIGSTQWNQVDPTLEWGDVSATLQWINASEVSV
jgi:hypothetical protein